eukprot:s1247_g18.t1
MQCCDVVIDLNALVNKFSGEDRPAVPTEIRGSRLRPGSPAVPTGIWGSRLRRGTNQSGCVAYQWHPNRFVSSVFSVRFGSCRLRPFGDCVKRPRCKLGWWPWLIWKMRTRSTRRRRTLRSWKMRMFQLQPCLRIC